MSQFTEIKPQEITQNPFQLIGNDWALVTAGNAEKFNTMTISWGGVGIMWNKPVTFSFIRPQRYTFGFMQENGCFSMSFFDEEYRKALAFCGSKSGRDVDKV
ncbi:MAG: flavin reductase family protein, partial [Ruminococcus sp.]|nr:flavin reductase family protein [Ruminococcus sp.]